MPKVGHFSLIIIYLLLNSTLNISIRYAFGLYGFHFPLLLTNFHLLYGLLAILLYQRFSGGGVSQWSLRPSVLISPSTAALSIFISGSIALNNISLVSITLTLNQVIRSAVPVVTCIAVAFLHKRYPTPREFLSLLFLSMGVALCVCQGIATGSPVGTITCMVGLLLSSLNCALSGKLLKDKLNVLTLLMRTGPLSIALLLPVALYSEASAFISYAQTYPEPTAAIIVITSNVAAIYNICHYYMFKCVGPVTTTVIGQCKVVILVCISMAFLGEGREVTSHLALGTFVTLLGIIAYGYTKVSQLQKETLKTNDDGDPLYAAFSTGRKQKGDVLAALSSDWRIGAQKRATNSQKQALDILIET